MIMTNMVHFVAASTCREVYAPVGFPDTVAFVDSDGHVWGTVNAKWRERILSAKGLTDGGNWHRKEG